MKNLPILAKFLVLLPVFGVFSLAATSFLALQMTRIANEGMQVNNTVNAAAHQVALASEALQQARAAMEFSLLAANPDTQQQALSEAAAAGKDFIQHLETASHLMPANAPALDALRSRGERVMRGACGHAARGASAAATAQPVFETDCAPAFVALNNDMDVERQTLDQQTTAALRQLQRDSRRTLSESVLCVLIGLGAVVVAGYFGVRAYITLPLSRLSEAMNRLSQGELTVEVPETKRRDEIGQMAATVRVFKQAAEEKQRLEEEARRARTVAAAQEEAEAAARAASAAEKARVVENLAAGLERLAVGDLLFRIEQKFPTNYEKLRIDFNNTAETLLHTMRRIAANAGEVRSSAAEITQGADDLSRRTERQAASLEQTAAALNEITSTVRKATEGTGEARGLVREAEADAERSGKVVGETIAAMSGIEQSSRQIANIIGVIDEIAFQTNLLALNAGVEAARAGDAGRGFAVVATEVRALAQRSAAAAKEIKALISDSGAQVEAGVRLVNETGQALTRISGQVARLNALVTEIAASTQEQATGLEEVNGAVSQMDQVTQQNAAMVEQSTAASHALAAEAEELAGLVARFRIGNEMAGSSEDQAPKPPAEKTPARPQMVAAKGKFVPVAPAESDDWDEF